MNKATKTILFFFIFYAVLTAILFIIGTGINRAVFALSSLSILPLGAGMIRSIAILTNSAYLKSIDDRFIMVEKQTPPFMALSLIILLAYLKFYPYQGEGYFISGFVVVRSVMVVLIFIILSWLRVFSMDIYKQKPHLLSSVYSVASVFILPFFITDIYSITGFSFNTITPWIETVRFIHIALTIGLFLNLYSRKETYIDPRALNFLIGFALLWVYMYFMNYFITWYNAPAVNEYLSIKSISIIMSLFFPLVLIFYRKNAFAKVIMVLILISHLVTLMG